MFLINLRMALYSVSMAQHIKKESLIMRLLGAYLLTDEAYAVSANRFNDSNIKKMPYYLVLLFPYGLHGSCQPLLVSFLVISYHSIFL